MEIAAQRRRLQTSGFAEPAGDDRGRRVDEHEKTRAPLAGASGSSRTMERSRNTWSKGQVLGFVLLATVILAFVYAQRSAGAESWREVGGGAGARAAASRTKGYRPR
jgi:hypothetical protein